MAREISIKRGSQSSLRSFDYCWHWRNTFVTLKHRSKKEIKRV